MLSILCLGRIQRKSLPTGRLVKFDKSHIFAYSVSTSAVIEGHSNSIVIKIDRPPLGLFYSRNMKNYFTFL